MHEGKKEEQGAGLFRCTYEGLLYTAKKVSKSEFCFLVQTCYFTPQINVYMEERGGGRGGQGKAVSLAAAYTNFLSCPQFLFNLFYTRATYKLNIL